jgi:hypothetical protein
MLALPCDERAELQAMSYLSSDALRTIAREQMQPELQDVMSQLMDKNSKGTITENELRELAELVARGQRLTLRKAQAMKLLLDRGYAVSLDALKPVHD